MVAVTGENSVEFAACSEANSIGVVVIDRSGRDKTVYHAQSVVSNDNSGSRRSERIAKKRKTSVTDSQSGCYISRKAQCLSDRSNKRLQHETKTGLTDTYGRQRTVDHCHKSNVKSAKCICGEY